MKEVSDVRRVIAYSLVAILYGVGCAHLVPQTVKTHSPPSVSDTAWAIYLAGDAVKAEKEFDKALDIDRNDSRSLLGKATIAHEAGRYDEARSLWMDILERVDLQRDPWAASIQEMAAAKVIIVVGEAPGEKAFAERLANLDMKRLTREAKGRVLALRSHLARRFGDEIAARALDDLRGCPARWVTSGPYGRLPRLDLAKPFPPEKGNLGVTRFAIARGCSFAVETPVGEPGVAYATTWIETSQSSDVVLTVAIESPWRAFVDGKEIWREDATDHFAPRSRTVALTSPLPGWHRVSLKIAAPGPRTELTATLSSAAPLRFSEERHGDMGGAVSARLVASSSPPETTDALAAFLRGQTAARDADSDAGAAALHELTARAPKFVPAILLAAQLASEDPSLPARFSRDRARRLLEKALELDPSSVRARYNLALMELQDDHAEKALARIEGAPGWRAEYLRYQALHARGWQYEAERALGEARRIDPDACVPLEGAFAVARDHFHVDEERRLAVELAKCTSTTTWLAEVLRDAGDFAGAVAEWRRLLELDPTHEQWREGLANALRGAGDFEGALAVQRSIVSDNPRNANARRQLADSLVAAGKKTEAITILGEGFALTPEAEELAHALGALGQGNAMDPWRVDGKSVIADFVRSKKSYASPAVILLDRTVTRVFPTGARLTLTHNIIRVQSKEGIDKFGEVQIPEGADVLPLRTVKADGSTREPEEILEKQSVSVPDLAKDDYVEFEYVDRSAAPAAFPGGFLGERFYFASFDAPLDRTEFVLVTPIVDRKPMPIAIDRRGQAPEPVVATKDDRGSPVQVTTWADRDKPQLVPEPSQPPFSEYTSSVRPASGVTMDGWRDFLREQSWGSLRANAELRELASKLTTDAKSVDDKVKAIDDWTRANIKNGGTISEAATAALASGEGSRVVVERALLEAAHVPTGMMLVRPASAAALDGPVPDLEGFDEAVATVEMLAYVYRNGQPVPVPWGSRERALDPRFRHQPVGQVTPLLRGQAAIQLESWLRYQPGAMIDFFPNPPKGYPDRIDTIPGYSISGDPLKAPTDARDERKVTMDAVLSSDGDAEVTIDETLTGWPAVEWREALERITPDRLRAEFEQRTLGFFFPGATLVDLQLTGKDDDRAPLGVKYKFHAPHFAAGEGRKLIVGASFPALLSRRYVGVARRTAPLEIQYAVPTTLIESIHLPAGARAEVAPPFDANGFAELHQKATVDKDVLRIESRYAMPYQRVPPARYGELTKFAQSLDAAESRVAEISPAP